MRSTHPCHLDMYGLNHEVHEASHTFVYYHGVSLLLTNNEHGHMKSAKTKARRVLSN
jgi:hypothetical protein